MSLTIKRTILSVIFLALTVSLASCGIDNEETIASTTKTSTTQASSATASKKETTKATTKKSTTKSSKKYGSVNDVMANMTLEEKIGQLFIVRPEALDQNLNSEQVNDVSNYGVTSLSKNMAQTLKKYHIGGVAMFGKNISSPSQIKSFIGQLQNNSDISLLVGVDEEGGTVSRIANSDGFNVEKFSSMESIGKTKDTSKAKYVGTTIGSYLKKYKFNLDFAPDSDVNTNPKNRVIGNRSYGSDPRLVAKMVSAEISGLHQKGIMSCIKHFPGHGDTTGDTHDGYVSVKKNWKQLKNCELIPFIEGIKTTDMVMISHITTPKVTSDGLPSSLSNEMIEGRLRNELNYNGVVISDSMAMGAITKEYTSSTCAVKAIKAGVDIILMPEDFVGAYNGVYNAVKSGKISEERINKSVKRILNLKSKYGLI